MSAGCVVAAAVCAKVLQERPQLLRLLLLRLPLLLQIFCKQTKGGGFVCIFSVCVCEAMWFAWCTDLVGVSINECIQPLGVSKHKEGMPADNDSNSSRVRTMS